MTTSLGRWIDGDDAAAPVGFDAQAERDVLSRQLRCAHPRGRLSPLVRSAMTPLLKEACRFTVVSIHERSVSVWDVSRCVEGSSNSHSESSLHTPLFTLEQCECTVYRPDLSHALVPSFGASGLRGVSAVSHAVGLHHARAF